MLHKNAPALQNHNDHGPTANATSSPVPAPPTGQAVVRARNAKRTALEEFARDHWMTSQNISTFTVGS